MKVGIIGAGNIAHMMSETLMKMTEATPYAIASRDLNKTKSFVETYGFTKAYGSYESLVNDPEVELVYIATPHAFHYEHGKLCLEHGKPILVEKAFTSNAREAEALISLGKEHNLLVAEAIWTRYMPSREMIDQLIQEGTIGEVQSLTANLGYLIKDIPRIVKPELAGGALLDLGVYTLNFASMILGDQIMDVVSSSTLMASGVDNQNSITLTYPNGSMALLHTTVMAQTDRKGIIYGDKGTIVVENINNCEAIKVYDLERNCVQNLSVPEQITGFEYQVMACKEALDNGMIEVNAMPHKEIIRIMKLMDTLRKSWGVEYPSDSI